MAKRHFKTIVGVALAAILLVLALPARARASESLCDPAYQDCRAPLLNLINNETVGIDVAFWFMQDARYKTAILNRWAAGVPVRILVDPRANPSYPGNSDIIAAFAAAGIPIRYRIAPGILHWKTMIFAGQNFVEFDGANYTPTAFVYQSPYSDYEDESIYFCDDPSIVNSFKTKYDDFWTDYTYYNDYANINNPPARLYPTYTKDPALNFPQQEDYALRILKRYAAETQKIDVIMYRVTDERHTNAMIAAQQRGVPVRIIGEIKEYRVPSRQWVSYNMDKMWAAGIPYRIAAHAGLNHQKLVIMYNQALAVFGSSNWTSPSANSQQEHNYFTTKPWMFQWFVDQFERKWNNLAPNGAQETDWFVPLPPDKPVILSPADTTVGQSISMALKWDGGFWAHYYDVYFGTDPNPPLFASNLHLGPTDSSTLVTQKLVLPLLQHGTTYYWRVVGRTMAGLTAKSPIVSFTTAGTPPQAPNPPAGASTIVMWASTDVPTANITGAWQVNNDTTAAGGQSLWNPDHGQSKISPPLATPLNYFETTFNAVGGTAYQLWVRLKAQGNSLNNNSVSIQFDNAVDQFGSPLYPIGQAQGAEIVLTDPSGTLSGWGWADNAFNGEPTPIYFPTSGTYRLRVQQRSDGAMVDQIILSPDVFYSSAPGATKNDATIYGSTIDGAAPPSSSAPSLPPSPPMPAGWQQADIGTVGLPGYTEFDNGTSTFTVAGSGADVWGKADALHFTYLPLSGDGTIVAHVTNVQNTDPWVKAGVMIRETVAAGSRQAFMLLSYSKGTAFQRRLVTGSTSTSTTGSTTTLAPYWLRMDRAGSTFTAYQSADGISWALVGSDTIAMGTNALIGLGVSSHGTDTIATATFDQVSVNGAAVSGSCAYAISPSSASAGSNATSVAVQVYANAPSCGWTATAADSWLAVSSGASGAGDGWVTVNVAQNTGAARTSTVSIAGQTFTVSQAAAPPTLCGYTIAPTSATEPGSGDNDGVSVTTSDPSCTWTATSNASWLTISSGASGTGSMAVGYTVAANPGAPRTGTLTIAGQTFNVTQASGSAGALPLGWSNGDIGTTGVTGRSTYDSTSSTFSIKGGGADVWGSTDAFQYAYQPLNGDGSIVARVVTVQNTNAWVKAGVMMRDGTSASAANAFMLVSYSKGLAYQRRGAAAGTTVSTPGAASPAPYWVRLVRTGNIVVGSQSTDGVNWTVVDTDTVPMNASILVGLAVSSHNTASGATATFDNVTVTSASPSCSYSISPGSHSVWSGGASDTVSVMTGSSCSWTASSNASWLSISGAASGTGNGSVGVTIDQNTGDARTGTMTIAGQTFTVQQAAAPCTYAISPGSQSIDATGATMPVTLTTRSSCTWAASTSDPSWLTVTSATSGTGPATVSVTATANSGAARSATVTIGGQPFAVSQAAYPWSNQDIGAVGVGGSTTANGGVYSVTGAGADVWGTADALQYTYQTLTGDGSIVARVATIQNTNAWVKAGVMFRQSLDPGSAQGFMLVSYSKGLAFQRRVANGGVSTSTTGATGIGAVAPYWIRLDRVGNAITAYQSPDGTSWTLVDTDTIPMTGTVYVGLGVSSHSTTATATATFDHVTIAAGTPVSPTALPSPWTHQDVGAVGVAGLAWYNSSTSTTVVKGAGADIYGTADAFHYVYQPLSGDGTVTARVTSVQNTNAWVKAGVMIRETLDPGSAQALMLLSYSKGEAFQRRLVAGGASTSTTGPTNGAPFWVRLQRAGNTITAYSSPDGVTWTQVGTDTFSMAANVTVGLAVSSHTTTATAQVTFDNITVTQP